MSLVSIISTLRTLSSSIVIFYNILSIFKYCFIIKPAHRKYNQAQCLLTDLWFLWDKKRQAEKSKVMLQPRFVNFCSLNACKNFSSVECPLLLEIMLFMCMAFSVWPHTALGGRWYRFYTEETSGTETWSRLPGAKWSWVWILVCLQSPHFWNSIGPPP